MPDTSQGVSIGDAVLSFIGDTQQLDQSIDNVGAKVEAGMSRSGAAVQQFENTLDSTGTTATEAGENIEAAMTEKATPSIREARGEAMLLGEALGVRLPRHVSSFVATLPGVGEALESAFAATAVFFVLDAVIKLTEKMSDFLAVTFVFMQNMKDADAATASLNKTILDQVERLKEAEKAFDRVGLSAERLARLKIGDDLEGQLQKITAELNKQNEPLKAQAGFWEKTKNAMIDVLRLKEIGTAQEEADAAKLAEIRNNQTQADKAAAEAHRVAAEQNATVDKEAAIEAAKEADKFWQKNQKQLDSYSWDAQQKILALGHALNNIMAGVNTLPAGRNMTDHLLGDDFKDKFGQYEEAAKTLGITLRSDLVTELNEATKARDLLRASGVAGTQEMRQADLAVEKLTQDLHKFDTEGKTTITSLIQMGTELKKGKDDWQAFSTEMGSAMASALAAGQGVGKAAEAAVEQELAALSKKALAQAIYYTGLGFAALASMDYSGAAQYFEAAGILGGIGVGSGVAAHAMGGGGSGSNPGGGSSSANSASPIQTSGSTSQAPATTTNVQRFAAGALVSQPTLAMIGDAIGGGAANEGVLPLDNPDAMRQIAGAIAEHLDGPASSAGHTFNMRGHFSKSEMKEIVKKISHGVQHGTMSVHSSSTGRITRRSP
jgi:hypothetical protein